MKLPASERRAIKAKQGRPLAGVELKLRNEEGRDVPHDGRSPGHLVVRGPWVVKRYFNAAQDATDAQGWFDTGDIATIDPYGYMQIVDRAKDVIKSGGEWISSVAIEDAALRHGAILDAAAIGAPHPKWDERPLLLVVLREGERLSGEEIRAHLSGQVARWWLPDEIRFVSEIPRTASGKIDKMTLRRMFVAGGPGAPCGEAG